MYIRPAILLAAVAAIAPAACSPVLARAMSGQQIVSNIDAITQLSQQTNNIAQSISITNFFSTAPQLIDNFRQIITLASNDVTAMDNSKKLKRLDNNPTNEIGDVLTILEDPSEILGDQKAKRLDNNPTNEIGDVLTILEDPSEILGDKKAKRASTALSTSDQQAVCNSFREFVMVHQQLLATVIGKHGLLSLTPFTQPIAQVLQTLEGGVDTLAFGIIDAVPTCAQDTTQNKNSLDQTLGDAINTYNE